MFKEPAQFVRGEKSVHNFAAENYFVTCCSNALAEFEVVGQIVDNGVKAANLFERAASHGQGRAQSEVDSVLNLACRQHSGGEVGSDANRFQFRSDGLGSNSTIDSCDQPNLLIRKMPEHALQVIR